MYTVLLVGHIDQVFLVVMVAPASNLCSSTQPVTFRAHQLVSFILMKKKWLFERSSDVGVGGNTLEVGGRKLGELVFRQIFMLILR